MGDDSLKLPEPTERTSRLRNAICNRGKHALTTMQSSIDFTHDREALSWVKSANTQHTDFPLQNLPIGMVSHEGGPPRVGVRIGEEVLDLVSALETGALCLNAQEEAALRKPTLNEWMGLGRESSNKLRHAVFEMLHVRTVGDARRRVGRCLRPSEECNLLPGAVVGDFTDFYTSIHHARRAGLAIRGNSSLNPNFQSMPIAYHGRSSSIVVSGSFCRRPYGKTDLGGGYRLSEKLDFELELGVFVGQGVDTRTPMNVDEASKHFFGFCLVNDWSARDIQRWEAVPLGPFLAKSFMTSMSGWIVTSEALAPFWVPHNVRENDAPPLIPQLASEIHSKAGALAISLGVTLQTSKMRESGMSPASIANTNFRHQYWTFSQMLVHHASNGCELRSGDLVSSGTVSGPQDHECGCLLERTMDGQNPLLLPNGESRGYLLDGDRVTFTGRCVRPGYRSIGFGECVGEVLGSGG